MANKGLNLAIGINCVWKKLHQVALDQKLIFAECVI